jgi:CDP-paratose 2-epimerase
VSAASDGPVLVVGGAGFIGSNLVAHLARSGHRVRVYDDLSRPGVEQNLAWLERELGARIETRVASVLDRPRLRSAVAGASAVFHLAAQVAVTTSLVEPVEDFEINARGTLELLEAVRAQPTPPPLVFTSTNKVYGGLGSLPLCLEGQRWRPVDEGVHTTGIGEDRPLDFCTPYGCSKGAADQYVLDYARSFGLPAAVFRMSCIYGPHQFGTEDQGWVAHFLLRALDDQTITIYGDGRQVRDVLYVDDLVDAFVRAWQGMDRVRGRAWNIGGGAGQVVSLLELVDLIEELQGRRPTLAHASWRAGDQRYYVSSTAAFEQVTGWRPRVGPRQGVTALHAWLVEQRAARRTSPTPRRPGELHA